MKMCSRVDPLDYSKNLKPQTVVDSKLANTVRDESLDNAVNVINEIQFHPGAYEMSKQLFDI